MVRSFTIVLYVWLAGWHHQIHSQSSEIEIIGQMKDVMWKGELFGKIDLDTISNKKHLYGLGPVEYLRGEILIMDGVAYTSTVVDSISMRVEETYAVKAPFFGYDHIPFWLEQRLPESIRTLEQLEQYLDTAAKFIPRPFFFQLSGTVSEATIHVVNLPEGTEVHSPEEAHQGQINYTLFDIPCDILGFFSTTHQAIFTHHDTFLHMHLITEDKMYMGHLDSVVFKSGTMSLLLPMKE